MKLTYTPPSSISSNVDHNSRSIANSESDLSLILTSNNTDIKKLNSYQPMKRNRRQNCYYEQNKIIGIPYKTKIQL
jgi:hypothetical protein